MIDTINKAFYFAEFKHRNQKRKYTGDPYIYHCVSVSNIVHHLSNDAKDEMFAAALLHDTLEDTDAAYDELVQEFGTKIANLVLELTDVYTKESYPQFNRENRKILECARIAEISDEAKTIKVADLIDNTSSIVQNDYKFAKVYLEEKEALLNVLIGADEGLLKRAWGILKKAKNELAARNI